MISEQFARLANECFVNLGELLPSEAAEACRVLLPTHLTYPDVTRFEGKTLLICIGSSPKNLRFMGRPAGGELTPYFSCFPMGPIPTFLVSQMTGKRTLDIWHLEPGHVS